MKYTVERGHIFDRVEIIRVGERLVKLAGACERDNCPVAADARRHQRRRRVSEFAIQINRAERQYEYDCREQKFNNSFHYAVSILHTE